MEAVLQSIGITVSQVVGVMNILAGLMVVSSLGIFIGGGIYYLAYLGLPRRIDGTNAMFHGVRILFALIVILGLVRFVQNNINLTVTILTILFLAFIVWLVYQAYSPAAPASDDEH